MTIKHATKAAYTPLANEPGDGEAASCMLVTELTRRRGGGFLRRFSPLAAVLNASHTWEERGTFAAAGGRRRQVRAGGA
jgi:hypothetical protein